MEWNKEQPTPTTKEMIAMVDRRNVVDTSYICIIYCGKDCTCFSSRLFGWITPFYNVGHQWLMMNRIKLV